MKFLFLLVLILVCTTAIVAQPLGLIPYRKGNSWGYANAEGKIVIEPAYERTYFFTNDSVARFKKNGLFGYLDPSGKVKLKAQYEKAGDFILGVASVELNKKSFCINRDGVEDECNPQDEPTQNEGGDFQPIEVYKDSLGSRLVFHPQDDTTSDHFDEVRLVKRYFFPTVNHFAIVRKNNLFGAYNEMGILIAPIEFEKVDILDMDTYKAMKEKRWGANDVNGNQILPFEYDSIRKVTELLFQEDRLQKNNQFIVSKNSKFGVLDMDRKTILKLEYDGITPPKPCTCPNEYVVEKDKRYGLADFKGNLIIPMKYAAIEPFQASNVTLVKTMSGQEGYIDQKGTEFFSE